MALVPADPTETSPLLNSDNRSIQISPQVVDPGAGIAPDGAVIGNSEDANVHQNVSRNRDVEEQSVQDEDRSKQFSGMPEVKKQLKYILPAVALGVFLSAADQTIIVSSYGLIGTDLKALNKTSWIATSYLLTLTAFQPLYGKLSDIFGRKPCLLVAYFIFGLGCLFCGFARDINDLIAARALSGVGGAGMTTVVSILLSDVVTLRERGKWQGYINIIYAAGAATGAPLGGIMADYIGWRWAFNFQAPLCAVSILAVSLVLKLPKRESGDWRSKMRRIDFLGALILILAVFTLLIGLDRGGNVSWASKWTLIPLAVSLPLFGLFILVETKVAAEPFAPGHIIFNGSLIAGYLCNFFSFAGWLAALFYIPLHFQVVDNLSATQASLRLIPSVLCGVSGSLLAGFYMQKTGKYYYLTVICYFTLTIGLLVIFLFSGVLQNSQVGIVIGMCISAFSNGIGVTTSLIALIANSTYEDQAVVTACSYLFRSLGSVTGVCISATVFNNSLRTNLTERLSDNTDAAELADRVRQSLAYIKTLEPTLRKLVLYCYAVSTRSVFALQIALVSGAFFSAWFIREKSLSR